MNGKGWNYLWSLVLLIYSEGDEYSRCCTYEWQGMELPAATSEQFGPLRLPGIHIAEDGLHLLLVYLGPLLGALLHVNVNNEN
jgi:hypothetical protein